MIARKRKSMKVKKVGYLVRQKALDVALENIEVEGPAAVEAAKVIALLAIQDELDNVVDAIEALKK